MTCALAGTHVDTIVNCILAKFQQYHPQASQTGPAPAAALQGEAMLFYVCLERVGKLLLVLCPCELLNFYV